MWNLFIAHRWSLLPLWTDELLTPAIKYKKSKKMRSYEREKGVYKKKLIKIYIHKLVKWV